jgi:hypothetical protein
LFLLNGIGVDSSRLPPFLSLKNLVECWNDQEIIVPLQ